MEHHRLPAKPTFLVRENSNIINTPPHERQLSIYY